jgi:hypothetical protein
VDENEVSELFLTGSFIRTSYCSRPVQDAHWNMETLQGTGHDPSMAADLMLFLASDASRGINGAIVPIDNAWSVI